MKSKRVIFIGSKQIGLECFKLMYRLDPGAFTFSLGKKIIIWKAHPLKIIYYGTPGQVVKISNEGVWVVCGDQRPLVLEIVQEEKGEKIAARDLIKTLKTRFDNKE